MARFRVDVSDELCAALDTAGNMTGASRNGVLAVLIRIHIQQLIRFMGNHPETMDGGEGAVTVEEVGDSGNAPFHDARARYTHELEVLIRALGLTPPPTR